MVNGIKCNVFANLKHALVEARHFWKQTHKRRCRKTNRCRNILLWVDQICKNQQDLGERSHQVGMMRDIYEQAKQVLVCLSTSEGTSVEMSWLCELIAKVPTRHDDRDNTFWPPWGFAPKNEWHESRLMDFVISEWPKKDFIEGWKAFYDVM